MIAAVLAIAVMGCQADNDEVTAGMDRIEGRLAAIEATQQDIEVQLAEMKAQLPELRSVIDEISRRMEEDSDVEDLAEFFMSLMMMTMPMAADTGYLDCAALVEDHYYTEPMAPDTAGKESGSGLSGTTWTLEAIGDAGSPEPALAGVDVTVEFSEHGNEVSGWTGCNSYGGNYYADEFIFFTEMLSWTEAGCANQPEGAMEQEERFLDLMVDCEGFELNGSRLTLTDGEEVMVFVSAGG